MLVTIFIIDLCLIFTFLFQSSQAAWPAHTIHQNFYDLYIANRSYEKHYRVLFENSNDSHGNRELFDKVTKHFLVVEMYMERLAALDIKDKPKFTPTSLMSHLGGALNLWAGITVVVLIEAIELCYEVLVGWFSRKPAEDKSRSMHGCESTEGST